MPGPEEEHLFLARLAQLASRNRVFRSYIGLGYHDTVTPSVILRMVMENPGWYTPYTPYQAEIAQGRLESLVNFQTVVSDLTGMDIANASLLDEATAAAEAMALLHRVQTPPKGAAPRRRFLVGDRTFPQTIDVLRARAEPLGLEIAVAPLDGLRFDEETFGLLAQYPDERGRVVDLRPIIERAHAAGVRVAVATDLLALVLLTPPGEMGADVAFGNSQRFGVPLGYGGPHAAFFATRKDFVRHAPGRIIGVSVDAHGRTAYRMALATREQHIRREKATSNICTAQALLANMAAMYAVYHGPDGLREIAQRVHEHARALHQALAHAGLRQLNDAYFDTLCVECPDGVSAVRQRAEDAGINLRYLDDRHVSIALNERVTAEDVADIAAAVSGARRPVGGGAARPQAIPATLVRTTPFLTHPVFNQHRSETQMMRYIRHLERKDLGLDTAMIPLGSCTMKLNAATEMIPVTWEGFSRIHPFVPARPGRGLRRDPARRGVGAVRHHRVCRGVAAAQLRRPGGVRGPAGRPRLPSRARRVAARRGADPGLRPRHQPRQRRHGGHDGRGRGQRAGRGSGPGRSRGQGHQVRRSPGVPDDHLPVDARGLRGTHPGHLRRGPRARRPGVHGRRQHERAGGPDQPGGDRRRRLPPEPAQDVRDPARRRRAGDGADWRRRAPGAVPAAARARARPAAPRASRRCRRRRGAAPASS